MLTRTRFLTIAATIAMAVGATALLAPDTMLASKGVTANAAASVWMREVGAILVAIGAMAWAVRHHPDSPTLRAFLFGNALLQVLLLPIEVIAFVYGPITLVWGIVPNTALHMALATGFFVFAQRMSAATGQAMPR
jgi:hypothetical protein